MYCAAYHVQNLYRFQGEHWAKFRDKLVSFFEVNEKVVYPIEILPGKSYII